MAGTIVVLNGPSSAGKSTLAKAVRGILGTHAVAVPTDRLASMAHPEHPLNWALYAALCDATFAAAAAFARAGFAVIVDTVFERRACFESAERAFSELHHRYVAVTCELDELDRREQARGNRPIGLARRQRDTVHHDVPYELRIDTTQTSVEDYAKRVAQLFR
jgi:chloramphenicol 3-O phosphotransferase